MNHWLVKSEPNVFSVDDLAACPDQTRWWKHVRNYQARNFMRDDMQIGDRVFFYHSNTEVPAIVGLAEIASEPYPDPDAFNPDAKYYDPKSDPENPKPASGSRSQPFILKRICVSHWKNLPRLVVN